MKRFWDKVTKTKYCWEWTGAFDSTGYGGFKIENKKVNSHRVAWILTYGKIPQGLWVLHKCDNRKCVNPKHLYLGTRFDNIKDAIQRKRLHGSGLYGESHPAHKLTKIQVLDIIDNCPVGSKTKEFAKKYDISEREVRWVKSRSGWKKLN